MSEQESQMDPIEASQAGADDGDVFFVTLQYRGVAYSVPVQAEDSVASIFDFVQEALDFPRENCKLICRGKMLRPDHDGLSVGEAGLAAGSKLMLVASSAHDVSFVQASRPDPLVKGFAEEERDERNRQKRARAAGASAWGTKQDAEFKFCSIKAEFKYSEPPPFEAERLLQRLSTDPGIIEIMKSRKFKVGILTEMSPQEAQDRMAKRGTPNMDLLGYNQNAGEMIVLRLRTDSLKGFRPYHDLINTLIHELTHNVWGPHDHNFWKLFGELKAQYMRFHRFWSHGGQAADSNAAGQFQGFTGDDGEEQGSGGFGRVLGAGAGDAAEGSARARALLAAEARRVETEALGSQGAPGGLPNFLAGDGSWTFVCPCGQVHSSADLCPVATTALRGVSAAPAEAASGAELGQAAAGNTAEASAAAEAAAAGPSEGVAEEQPPAALPQQPAAEQPATPAPAALPQEAPLQDVPMEEVPELPQEAPVQDVAMEGAPEPGEPAQEAPAAPAAASLLPSFEELAAQGLDGAAVWLQRFEEQLRALRSARPGGPAARDAVALLLRLVSNVVDSPQEPRFRRIRADNPRVRASLLGAGAGAEALMYMLGFEAVTESGERVFVLRDAVFDCARLRMGQELLERELNTGYPTVQ